jgi:serine/threonine-protein kinase
LHRRQFLEASLVAALAAGCSGEDAPPDVLHVSGDLVHAEDLNGELYRLSRSGNTVSKVGAGGAATWTTGARGSGPAQFDFPTALAADNRGRVLVVDRGNARIQILEGSTGRYLGTFGASGNGPGQFRIARHIAVSADRIFVVDQVNRRVVVFDMNGNAVSAIGGLDYPRGVAVDRGGSVYVSDSTNRAIKRFSPTGTFEARVDNGNVAHPHGLAFDRFGDLWVADGVAGRVVVLTPQGAVRQTLATRLPDGRSAAPSDVALANRDIFVRAAPNA